MILTFSNAVKSDRLQAFTRALDAGGAGGKIKLYGGVQPASGAAHSQELLSELILPKPSAVSVENGVLTITAPFSAMALLDFLSCLHGSEQRITTSWEILIFLSCLHGSEQFHLAVQM